MTSGRLHPRREVGLDRLDGFVARAGRAYAERRNYDFGPLDRGNVSTLSPWLRHRLLLEPEVLKAVVEEHGAVEAEAFIQEVVWRTYFKGYLDNRPGLWVRYRSELDTALDQSRGDPAVERAITGETGIECFDAWTRELREYGYLHNHARMWYASIWVHTLGLPWQIGADFFLRHLLDGDPASNLLSWRWVCGLHTRGKSYLARASNVDKFTDGRFASPVGLATSALPLDDEPAPIEGLPTADAAPRDPGFALLITEEDCDPLSLDLSFDPAVVVGCDLDADWSPQGRAPEAAAFARGAVDDAVRRAAEHWAVPSARITDGNALSAWVTRERVSHLVIPWVPAGPIADALHPELDELTRAGIKVSRVRRAWDELAWPAATHGFFRMKKIIPELLERFV